MITEFIMNNIVPMSLGQFATIFWIMPIWVLITIKYILRLSSRGDYLEYEHKLRAFGEKGAVVLTILLVIFIVVITKECLQAIISLN